MSEGFKINVNAEVTSRLNIEPVKKTDGTWLFDALCPVVLTKVELTTQTYEKGQFKDLPITVLNFEFTNLKFNKSDPDRFYVHQEKAIGTQKIENGDYVENETKKIEGFITAMWGRIKHIMDATKGSPNYRNIVEDKAFLKLINFPTKGTGEEISKFYTAFFTYVCEFINGNGATTFPMYLDKKGNGLAMWAKLLPDYSEGRRYQFPSYVEKGFLEPMVINEKGEPTLAKIVKVYPKETVELRSAGKAPANTANAAQGIAPGAIPANVMNILGIPS
jgi:hypothetical protein